MAQAMSREEMSIFFIESARRRWTVRAGKRIQNFHERERVVHEINRVCDEMVSKIKSGDLVLYVPDSPLANKDWK